MALTRTDRYQNTIDAMRRSGASSCPRKALREGVRFIQEFSYAKNLQRPKYRRISAQAADAGGGGDSSCARNRDVRQFYSRRNRRRRPLRVHKLSTTLRYRCTHSAGTEAIEGVPRAASDRCGATQFSGRPCRMVEIEAGL